MQHVIICSSGGKFQLVSNFTELHTLTQATRSYVLLLHIHTYIMGVLNNKGF